METLITKRLKGRNMEYLFDLKDVLTLSIKHYRALNCTEDDYNPNKYYVFEILIRHPDAHSADYLFETLYHNTFTKKKLTFFVSTEKGRVKGRYSFYIAEIDKNGLHLIDNTFTCSMQSHRGLDTECISRIVELKRLPKIAIAPDGYRNNHLNTYRLIVVNGSGLNYINQLG